MFNRNENQTKPNEHSTTPHYIKPLPLSPPPPSPPPPPPPFSSLIFFSRFAFLEFEDGEKAQAAAAALNGHPLDKKHIFRAIPYSQLEELTNVPDEFKAEQNQDYKPKEVLRSWLLDPRPLDQYCINYGTNTEIYWNEPSRKPDPIKSRQVDRIEKKREKGKKGKREKRGKTGKRGKGKRISFSFSY